MTTGKGLIRSTSRKGVRSGKFEKEGPGRALLRGSYVSAHETDVRRRLDNVAERATRAKPDHGVVSILRGAEGIEVVTSTQALAHRIVREMRKAFRGRTSYRWSDSDGSLLAIWDSEA